MKAIISITKPEDIADTKHHLSKTAYIHGRLDPNYLVPVVWKHPNFTVDFDFYVQRGYVNAMFDGKIEEFEDAISIDRRK